MYEKGHPLEEANDSGWEREEEGLFVGVCFKPNQKFLINEWESD